ncbi:septal ring lytic transglycosylase RlpA family protein [Imhoffiella purpurea]|uniref:Endolytic peptidoglycan transglycosylase RlpA n=1 Tax=Imhoffiella purpurea TaxID=1249627 RepID=W9VCB3_9GAMM|nr:septal ring lytic transglycosylase RlpA family protein [Imhoffiella purpurea]EXJ17233.1 Rare lipoprotein A precursor [Imhoffiella purpurea]
MRHDPTATPRRRQESNEIELGVRIAACLLCVGTLAGIGGCSSTGDLADGDEIPARIARIPDAVPKVEPLAASGNPSSYVVGGKRYYPIRNSRGHVERGLASWYGRPFHGRKTSSGEIYDMNAMTAAHKTLPLPTYARVTNMENGRSVVIRINDRGPFHGSRIIDLSYTAAVKLGVVKKGTAMVEVRAIDPRRPASDPGPFLAEQTPRSPRPAQRAATTLAAHATRTQRTRPMYLQIGAFGQLENAEKLRLRLGSQLGAEQVRVIDPQPEETPLYRVRIGPLASEQDADRVTRRLASLGLERPRRVSN